MIVIETFDGSLSRPITSQARWLVARTTSCFPRPRETLPKTTRSWRLPVFCRVLRGAHRGAETRLRGWGGGLELRNPCASMYLRCVIIPVGSAQNSPQRVFAFELRRWGDTELGPSARSQQPFLRRTLIIEWIARIAAIFCRSKMLRRRKTSNTIAQFALDFAPQRERVWSRTPSQIARSFPARQSVSVASAGAELRATRRLPGVSGDNAQVPARRVALRRSWPYACSGSF